MSIALTTDCRGLSSLAVTGTWRGPVAALAVHAAVALAIFAWPAAQPAIEPVTVVELVLERPPEPPAPSVQEPVPTPQPQAPAPRVKAAAPRPAPAPAAVAPQSRAETGMAPAAAPGETSSTSEPSAPPVAVAPPPKGVESAVATPLSQTKPFYPRIARQRGWQGVVIVRVSVDEAGLPCHAAIRDSSGHAVLDEAALDAVRTWRFSPARRDGQAVASAVDVPVRFSLGES